MKEFECDIWCPTCKLYYAKVYRIEHGPGMYKFEREPENVAQKCTVCYSVLVRKA